MSEKSKEFNRFGNKTYYEFIFKIGDDLRQDQLVLQMINFMNSLLTKKYIFCEFTPYKALATSKDDGFLEFVPNAITYFDIKKKYYELKLYFKSILKSMCLKFYNRMEETTMHYIDLYFSFAIIVIE